MCSECGIMARAVRFFLAPGTLCQKEEVSNAFFSFIIHCKTTLQGQE